MYFIKQNTGIGPIILWIKTDFYTEKITRIFPENKLVDKLSAQEYILRFYKLFTSFFGHSGNWECHTGFLYNSAKAKDREAGVVCELHCFLTVGKTPFCS